MTSPIPESISPLPSHLEEVRGRFEAAWQRTAAGGTLPRIEDHLHGQPNADRLTLLHELVALEVACRRQRGEQPRVEEYRGRFPELQLEWLDSALASTAGPGQPRKGHTLRCPHCHNPIHLTDAPGDEVLCPGCGGSFRVRDARFTETASASKPLGRFQLLERVGQGAFGAVWKARDTTLDRIVALKILHSGLGTDAEEMQRFEREARATAQLRHPGVVTVHEVLTLDGLPVLVCDFVHGVTLRELLEVRRLTFRESAQLAAQLAEALEYAHSLGVVHRDLKPANVMLEAGSGGGELGRPLLMDFGLALRGGAEVTLTLDGHVLGTPAYMSPEQAAGKSHCADRRSDVYSLGVVLYELLTGELPFRGSKAMMLYQVLREEPRSPRQLNARVPRDLETVCLKCLQKEPHKRYGSARELADDLKRFLAGEAVRARPVGRAERLWRWARQRPAQAALIVLTVLSLAGVVVGVLVFASQADWGRRAAEEHAHKEEGLRRVADNKREEADRERLKGDNLRIELEITLRQAKDAEKKAKTERERADANAKAVGEQRSVALETLKYTVFDIQKELKGRPEMQDLRRKLLEKAQEGLQQMARFTEPSPQSDHTLAWAHFQIGDIFLTLGQVEKAQIHYYKGHLVAKARSKTDPQTTETRVDVAVSYERLGRADVESGQVREALTAYQEGHRILEDLVKEAPQKAQVQEALLASYFNLGTLNQKMLRYQEGLIWLEHAQRMLKTFKEKGKLDQHPEYGGLIPLIEKHVSDCKAAVAENRPVAMVMAIKRAVTVQAGSKAPRIADALVLLYPGDRLTVPSNGEAKLVFLNDAHRERVKPDTQVIVTPDGCTPATAVERQQPSSADRRNLIKTGLHSIRLERGGAVGVLR